MTIKSKQYVCAISDALPAWLENARVPGAAAAILETGSHPAYTCAGVLAAGSISPITPETVFEAASLSKPLFAYAALRLASQGRLDLDAPLSGYLDEPLLPGEERLPLITARRVLSHSSGLPNWRRDGQPLTLSFNPGERFGYSGEGYVYLQRVVEKITGESLEPYIRRVLLDPLDMASTSYTWQPAFEANFAVGHDEQGSPLPKNRPAEANSATSLHTTLADYARFLSFLLDPSLAPAAALPQHWQEAMRQPHTSINPTTAWGLGWGLKQCEGHWVSWQWGDNTGFKHLAAFCPESGCGLLVLTNGESGWQVWNEAARASIDLRGEIIAWLSTI